MLTAPLQVLFPYLPSQSGVGLASHCTQFPTLRGLKTRAVAASDGIGNRRKMASSRVRLGLVFAALASAASANAAHTGRQLLASHRYKLNDHVDLFANKAGPFTNPACVFEADHRGNPNSRPDNAPVDLDWHTAL